MRMLAAAILALVTVGVAAGCNAAQHAEDARTLEAQVDALHTRIVAIERAYPQLRERVRDVERERQAAREDVERAIAQRDWQDAIVAMGRLDAAEQAVLDLEAAVIALEAEARALSDDAGVASQQATRVRVQADEIESQAALLTVARDALGIPSVGARAPRSTPAPAPEDDDVPWGPIAAIGAPLLAGGGLAGFGMRKRRPPPPPDPKAPPPGKGPATGNGNGSPRRGPITRHRPSDPDTTGQYHDIL